MSEQRLSRLQRVILESLYQISETIEDQKAWITHAILILTVAEKTGKGGMSFFGRDMKEGFQSTFSQSLRNLEGKGMIKFYKGWRRVMAAKLTEKGEAALSLTYKLRIREEAKARFEQVQKSVEDWIEKAEASDILNIKKPEVNEAKHE